jgi:hypothetical protein
LLLAAWVVAGGLLLYGGVVWIQALLWETGVQDTPASVGATAARWKLIFWEPFWVLGGVLSLLAIRNISKGRRADG